jgi:hypothetical protein
MGKAKPLIAYPGPAFYPAHENQDQTEKDERDDAGMNQQYGVRCKLVAARHGLSIFARR